MRITRLLFITLLFVGFSGSAYAFGLYVDRIENPNAVTCPVCHRPIISGGIHENAETTLDTEFGGGLEERGIKHTREKDQSNYLHVFVYRYQERLGGNFSVERPASVGFHVHLFQDNNIVKVFRFDETQQALSENVLRFFTFLRRGAKWIPVAQLAREGVEKALDELEDDLKTLSEESQ